MKKMFSLAVILLAASVLFTGCDMEKRGIRLEKDNFKKAREAVQAARKAGRGIEKAEKKLNKIGDELRAKGMDPDWSMEGLGEKAGAAFRKGKEAVEPVASETARGLADEEIRTDVPILNKGIEKAEEWARNGEPKPQLAGEEIYRSKNAAGEDILIILDGRGNERIEKVPPPPATPPKEEKGRGWWPFW